MGTGYQQRGRESVAVTEFSSICDYKVELEGRMRERVERREDAEFMQDVLHLRSLAGCPEGIFITCVCSWEDVRTKDLDLEQVLTEVLNVGEITVKTEMGSSVALVRP